MIRALLYLQLHTSWNRLRSRIQRLKKPKYLAGFLVGGLYFYFYFFRHFFFGRNAANDPQLDLASDLSANLELLGALALFILVALKWILPYERAALAFSEAEVSFLFPAPVDRRTLIHFKLLKSQAAILFTTLFMTLLSNRFGQSGTGWIHIAGWWIALSTLNLHFLGASFARTQLLEAGFTNWQRRLGILLLLAAAVGAVVFWARRSIPAPTSEDLANLRALWGYGRQALESGPGPYLLYPFRLVVRPFVAQNTTAFLAALWPALALLGLHYFWVVRADVAFEEASVELARKRAELIASARQGHLRMATRRPRPAPFALRPTGPAAVALLWKNLIGTRSIFTFRTWILVVLLLGFPAIAVSSGSQSSAPASAIGMFLLIGLFWSVLLGPQMLRQDFRQDWRAADILKGYPVAGWCVVLGELLAPAVLLAAIQWALLAIAVVIVNRGVDGAPVPLAGRLAVACGAALVLPMLDLVSLLMPNAAVLLFPAWFAAGQDSAQGIEAAGQRLIFVAGQLVVFLLAVLPAAGAFTLVFFLARFAVGWGVAMPMASAAAGVVLAGEVAAGVVALGRVFERCDLSAEL